MNEQESERRGLSRPSRYGERRDLFPPSRTAGINPAARRRWVAWRRLGVAMLTPSREHGTRRTSSIGSVLEVVTWLSIVGLFAALAWLRVI